MKAGDVLLNGLRTVLATNGHSWAVVRDKHSSGVQETMLFIGRVHGEFLGAGQLLVLKPEDVGPMVGALAPELDEFIGHGVWLHGEWRTLTEKCTTPAKDAAADAVQRWWERDPRAPRPTVASRRALRWWRR